MSTLEPMPYETIRVERDTEGVAVMVINRPEVHNAISRQMVEEMHHALGQLEADESCRALILTSAGGKAFMSGADIVAACFVIDLPELGAKLRGDLVPRCPLQGHVHRDEASRTEVGAGDRCGGRGGAASSGGPDSGLAGAGRGC